MRLHLIAVIIKLTRLLFLVYYKTSMNMGHKNDGGDAMVLLKQKILKSLLLRRTKKERVADFSLPSKTVSSVLQ